MSIASQPRPGAGGAPIVPADAVDPVLPADPPIDFRLEDDDGIPPDPCSPPPLIRLYFHLILSNTFRAPLPSGRDSLVEVGMMGTLRP